MKPAAPSGQSGSLVASLVVLIATLLLAGILAVERTSHRLGAGQIA